MKRMRMYLSSCFVLFMIAALLSCSRPIPPVPSPSISNSASDKRYFTEATGIKLGEKAQLLKYEKDREMLNGDRKSVV